MVDGGRWRRIGDGLGDELGCWIGMDWGLVAENGGSIQAVPQGWAIARAETWILAALLQLARPGPTGPTGPSAGLVALWGKRIGFR